jgi:hypothetical membrane protein
MALICHMNLPAVWLITSVLAALIGFYTKDWRWGLNVLSIGFLLTTTKLTMPSILAYCSGLHSMAGAYGLIMNAAVLLTTVLLVASGLVLMPYVIHQELIRPALSRGRDASSVRRDGR